MGRQKTTRPAREKKEHPLDLLEGETQSDGIAFFRIRKNVGDLPLIRFLARSQAISARGLNSTPHERRAAALLQKRIVDGLDEYAASISAQIFPAPAAAADSGAEVIRVDFAARRRADGGAR